MLQRVQTIYMLASVIAVLMLFLFPLATFQTLEATFELNAFGLVSVTESVPMDVMRWCLLGVLLLMMMLPFVAIFMYKKHKLQLRFLIFTSVLDILFYPMYFIFERPSCQSLVMSTCEQQNVEITTAMILFVMPVLSLVCCIMAMKGVLYDMALLSSADRLRPSRK